MTEKVKRKTGRPFGSGSTYTPEIADEVCARVSNGEPLAAVCRDMGVGLTTWYGWMDKHDGLREKIARAREAGHDMIAVDAMAIMDEEPPRTANGGIDSGFVSWQKHRVWTRLQLLAKWDRRYADKTEISGPNGGPVQIIAATTDERL
jgi:hypothetical protein